VSASLRACTERVIRREVVGVLTAVVPLALAPAAAEDRRCGRRAARVAGSRPSGGRGGELVLVELQDVVARVDQAPFGPTGGPASSVKAIEAPVELGVPSCLAGRRQEARRRAPFAGEQQPAG
jgi:hypothetical protein